MKHYLIDIETHVDETPDAKAIYEFEDRTECVASFHARLAAAMRNANCDTAYLLAVDGEGQQHRVEIWQRVPDAAE